MEHVYYLAAAEAFILWVYHNPNITFPFFIGSSLQTLYTNSFLAIHIASKISQAVVCLFSLFMKPITNIFIII